MCGGGGGDSGPSAGEITSSVTSAVNPKLNSLSSGQGQIKSGISGVSGQVSGVQNTVDGLGANIDSVGSSVTGGFNNLNTYLADQFGKSATDRFNQGTATRKAIQQVDDRNQASFGQLSDTLRAVDTGVTEGFADQTTRFDTLDQSVGGVQDTANRIETDVGSVQTAVDNGFIDTQREVGFVQSDLDTLSKDTTDAFNMAASERLKNVGTVTDNQSAISGDLATISGNQDLYYEDLSGTVNDIETDQGNFRTAFDDLAEKYGTDTETNAETVGRIETGLGDFAEEVRRGLGTVEDGTTNDDVIDAVEGVGGNVDGLEDTVEGGFTDVSGDVEALDLEGQIGQLITGMGENMTELERLFGENATAVADAFDDQGNLIEEVIAEDGTITRNQITDSGELMTSQFTSQGELIGTTSVSLLSAVKEAGDNSAVTELLSSLGTNIGNLSDTFLTEFGGLASSFNETGDLIKNEVAANGDVIERTLDAQGNVIENRFNAQGELINTSTTNINDAIAAAQAELGAGQQGLMSEMNAAQQTQFDNMAVQIAEGFDNQTGQMNTQVSDIAALASQMTDLDMGMRQEFYQMGGAFDDTGALIRQEVTENGETIRRNIDQNGNLLIEKFDQTGQALGNKVFNINEALAQLAGLGTLPGASVSMGNLSPALQAQPNGKTNVPTGGFMAPYSVTV